MITLDSFLEQLGIRAPEGALNQPLRVRVEQDILIKLDRIEAFVRSQGYRDVSRSDLVRAALIGFIDGIGDIDPDIINEPLRKELAQAGTLKNSR
jgi:hypothetical protein